VRQERGDGPLLVNLPLEGLLIEVLNQRQQPVPAFRVFLHDLWIHRRLLHCPGWDTPRQANQRMPERGAWARPFCQSSDQHNIGHTLPGTNILPCG
jgi:hypothetical protein